MLCDYFEHIKDDSEKMKEAENVVCEALECMKYASHSLYKDTCYKLHYIAYGNHFNEEMANDIVSELRNSDGTVGVHWDKSATDTMAKRLGISEMLDFYVLVNILYSKFASTLGGDGNVYAKMAKAIIDKRDGCFLKMYMIG